MRATARCFSPGEPAAAKGDEDKKGQDCPLFSPPRTDDYTLIAETKKRPIPTPPWFWACFTPGAEKESTRVSDVEEEQRGPQHRTPRTRATQRQSLGGAEEPRTARADQAGTRRVPQRFCSGSPQEAAGSLQPHLIPRGPGGPSGKHRD